MEGEESGDEVGPTEVKISWPTDVRHVAHVTFDKFQGFLGLPDEFEPEALHRAPSASATVFGVSVESMQCSLDSRGNSVPKVLLLLQNKLYAQGGLKAEGIFRIAADNSQEEFVRGLLNRGILPDNMDVHCLSGLIKSWFRELPGGLLDSLSPYQVMQCKSEEDATRLVAMLPTVKAALLDWAVNLMADVVEEHHVNKMSARNVAMVFAPNMTQMLDPLTALKHAVQVMNLLNMLIMKELKRRRDSISQQLNSNTNSQSSTEHQNTSINSKSRRTKNAEKQNSGTNASIEKGSMNFSGARGKVEESSDDDDYEPLWDQEPRQNGKISRVDSVVEHLGAFW
ncbi:rho GTPase-activating protein 1-like [Carex rostrata]